MNATQQQRILQGILQGAASINAQGNGMTIPALYTDYLPAELMDKPRDFFSYNVDFLLIDALGGTNTQTFTVQNDSDFLIIDLTCTVVDPTDEGVPRSRDACTVAFTDQGSGRQLQNRPFALSNITGTGQLPSYFPFPKFVDRASDFATTIVNNDPTEDVLVRFSFIGFKIFSFTG